MAQSNPIQVGFNGGQFGPLMAGRVDLARYKTACKTLKNFIPTVQGPAIKRSGTRFVKAVRDMSKKSRLIPFEFSRAEAYVLEFSDNAIRFIRNSGGIIEATVAISGNPTIAANCEITTGAAHGYATGDEVFVSGSSMAMINGQYFAITVTGATTFTIGVSTVGETTSGGPGTVARTYQITNGVASNAIPWNDTDLDGIQYAQDQDTMYLTHPDYAPHKLVRTSDTSWTCTEVVFEWPAFRDENISETTLYASAATGAAITITASAATFTSDMVGGYIKLGEIIETKHPQWTPQSNMASEYGGGGISLNDRAYYDGKVYELVDKNGGSMTGSMAPIHTEGTEEDNAAAGSSFEWTFINRGWGYGKITGYTSSTVVTVDVDTYGVEYPASVVGVAKATKKWAISAFCAEYGYPAAVAFFEGRLWFGGTEQDQQTFWGSRTNRYEDFELINADADSGLVFTIKSTRVNAIQWMRDQDVLMIGTRGGEYAAFSNSQDEAITPDNIKVVQRSAFGTAADIAPVSVDSALLMVHRNGRRVHELVYDINSEKNEGPDLTALADDILSNGATGLAYQAAPHRQVWATDANSFLYAMTYVRDQDVIGWAEFPISTAGSFDGGLVESVCVIPHPDGDQDQVWLSVRRALGTTKRWIEYIEKPYVGSGSIQDAFFVDAGSTYSGSAATTITGLLHLASQAVAYLANGVVGSGTVTSKGKLTVASSTKVQIGFAVSAELETMSLETGDTLNSSQGKRGRLSGTVIRLLDTGQGVEYGADLEGTMDTWTQEDTVFTGDTPMLTVPGGFARTHRLAIRHSTVKPCTVVSIMPQITVEVG